MPESLSQCVSKLESAGKDAARYQKKCDTQIRRIIKERKLTQSAIRKALKVDHSLISHILSGRRNWTVRLMRKFDEEFNQKTEA